MCQLRIGYLSTMYHTSHIIKAERWIEKRLNITPSWHLFPTGPAMVEAFSTGTIDLGYLGLPPAMMAIAREVSIICIAGGHVEGTVAIALKGYHSLDKPQNVGKVLAQFKGKALGTPTRGSIHDVIIRNLIEEKDVALKVKNYSWADLIPEALESGELAGAVGTPPLAVLCAQQCQTNIVIPPHLLWPFNPSYGIVVRKELLKKEWLVNEFLILHEKACNLLRENPQETAAVVSQELKAVNPDFVARVLSISPKYCASLPPSYIDSTMKFVPVLQKLGYITRELGIHDIFNTSLIQKIHPHPHHYYLPL